MMISGPKSDMAKYKSPSLFKQSLLTKCPGPRLLIKRGSFVPNLQENDRYQMSIKQVLQGKVYLKV